MSEYKLKIVLFGDLAIDSRRSPFPEDALDCLQDLTRNADLAIYNQEFPITESPTRNHLKSRFLGFKSTAQSCSLASRAGFNLACFANNHTHNYLDQGVIDTKQCLNSNGIAIVGAGLSLEEASEPFEIELKGLKIAIINCAEREVNCANNNHGGAAPIDIARISMQVKALVESSHRVIVSLHTGIDFCGYPSPRIKGFCRLLATLGASAVVCHHSHMVSGYEVYQGVPLCYGLGNLLTNVIVGNECRYVNGIELILSASSINFNLKYFYLDPRVNKLVTIQEDQHREFFNRIISVNSVLDNDSMLEDRIYHEFLNIYNLDIYMTYLNGSSYTLCRVMRKLRATKIHLWLMKKIFNKKSIGSWNIIRCDNHRDVIEIIYQKQVESRL